MNPKNLLPSAMAMVEDLNALIAAAGEAFWIDADGTKHPSITPFIREFAADWNAAVKGEKREVVL